MTKTTKFCLLSLQELMVTGIVEHNLVSVWLPVISSQICYRDDGSNAPWPDFGNGDVGLNQFTSSGATVTGLIEVDLNTPEPDPDL